MGEGKSHMTFNDYVAAIASPPREQRHGQWASNVLWFERADIAENLPPMLDPFYSDAVLPEFYKWVEENWNG